MTSIKVLALSLALVALPASARAQMSGMQDSTHKAMKMKMGKEERKEMRDEKHEMKMHPGIAGAVKALEHAKALLEKAPGGEFGGHRSEALKSTEEALKHARLALEYKKP